MAAGERPHLRARPDRRARVLQRDLLGDRDRPRHHPPLTPAAAGRRRQPLRGPRPAAEGAPGPLPRGDPDRDHVPRLPRVGVRRGEPRRRDAGLSRRLRPPRRPRGQPVADHRHRSADAVHDRLRRAGPEAGRPRPCRAGGHHVQSADRSPRTAVRAARRPPHARHALGVPAVPRRRDGRRADQLGGAPPDHRAGWRAGHPRGRGGADDPRGHRARRAARPRGDDPAHGHGHPLGGSHVRGGDRADRAPRATAGSPSTRSRSTRSSASSTRRTCCRSWSSPTATGRCSGRCCGRRYSCPSR